MKKSLVFLTLIALVLSLFAMGSMTRVSADDPTATPAPTITPMPSVEGTLTIWVDGDKAAIVEAIGKDFQAKYNVPVRIQTSGFGDLRGKFSLAAPTGEGPDIIVAANDWIGEFYANGLVSDIDLGDKAKEFDPVSLKAFTYDSKLLGVPYAVEAIAMYYNKDLVPTPPATWEDLKALAKKLQDDKKVDQGFAFQGAGDAYGTYPLLTGFGGYAFGRDKDGNYDPKDVGLDSPGAIKAAQELDAMVKAGLVRDGLGYDQAKDLFLKGKLALYINGPWELDNIKKAGINYGIAPIPKMEQDARPFVGVQGFMVSKFSKNELLAKAFLTEFVATPESMKAFYTAKFMIPAFMSVRKEVTNADMDAFAASVAVGDPMPAIPAMAAYWSTMGNAFTLIYQQKGDPTQIMKDAGTAARDAIAKSK
jgi:maltose-binding protein MalE